MGVEEANTSKTTMAMTTETETATTRDTSSRRRMRGAVVVAEEEARDSRGDTHPRTRTTRQEGGTQTEAAVIRGLEAAEDEEARIPMRRTHRREETAEAMAGEEICLHHEAIAGDTKARVDHPDRTWGEEVRPGVPGAQIQVVSVLSFLALHGSGY